MKLYRIYGIILRFLYILRRSPDRWSDYFYWPTLDLFTWGLTTSFFVTLSSSTSPIITMILSGLLFWLIVWRGQYEISINLLEEVWNKNLFNIFASPLKFSEWVMALVVLGIIKAALSFGIGMILATIFYKLNFFVYGFYVIPFMILLVMMGWSIGFFVAGLILRFGTKIQTLAWSFAALLSPFSAVYFPLSILPEWAQKIALLMPASHVFEGIREVINTGEVSGDKLLISLGLNIIYLILSLIFLRKSFDKVLEKGLLKVY
ncbi:ABC transporter permease [Candidatus Daviesbacteria bacterium]|nr:ABC transporter permease [Candidatus Daviesbacteria bacterium]